MNVRGVIGSVLVASLMIVCVAEAGGRCGRGQGQGACHRNGSCQASLDALPLEELSDFEKNSLLLMRQEEKLARDVYLTLGEKYDLPVFTNIPRAEQRHMDILGQLLARYGLDDPIADLERGQFSSKEMKGLYNRFVADGGKSVTAALQVGATIEDLDIHDLENALAQGVDNQDIALVYRNLAKGSRNHMRAFTTQLQTHDVTYKAQYISQADLESIVSSDWERGPAGSQGRVGNGCGKGRGQGKGEGCGKGRGYGHGHGRSDSASAGQPDRFIPLPASSPRQRPRG